MMGPHAYSHFLGKEGILEAVVSGKFPEKPEKGGPLVEIANCHFNQNRYAGGGGGPFPT